MYIMLQLYFVKLPSGKSPYEKNTFVWFCVAQTLIQAAMTLKC